MFIDREEREELNKLSKEVFGSASKWQKFLNNGLKELTQRTVVEVVPGENGAPDTTKQVKVPVLTPNGVKQYHIKHFTLETMKEWLLELKTKRDEFMAMIKKQQDEEKAKKEADELAKKINEDIGGSAI